MSTTAQAATGKHCSETRDVGLQVHDADRKRMQDCNQEMVTPSRDVSTAVQDASCPRVTIYCPDCFLAKDVEMDIFWQTNGKHRFCRVRCSTDACKTFVHRVGKWLRSPDERGNTVEAWLKHNNVLISNGARPLTMTVDLYTSQIVPDEASRGRAAPEVDAAPDSITRHCQEAAAAGAPATVTNSQSEQSTPLKRPLPTMAEDDMKKQRRDDQSFASVASGMPSQSPSVLCYARVLHAYFVSGVPASFLHRHIHAEACLQSLEAGGGGDCLFHSIGAALERMSQGGSGPAEHIGSRCDVGMFRQSTEHVVGHLRRVVAASLLRWEEADLLNFLVGGSLEESSGRWQDRWSPSRLLRGYGFGQLAGCDAVRAVGPNPCLDSDSGDLVVALTRSSAEAGGAASAEIFLPIAQGQSLLVALTNAVREEFEKCGNHHWGTVTDCRALSAYFDVGMLIFANSLQHGGTQCLVNVNALRGDHAYYIALWWHDSVHFRLAQYRGGEGSPWRSFWSAEDLPPSLRAHYNLCNSRAHVGSARRVAVS